MTFLSVFAAAVGGSVYLFFAIHAWCLLTYFVCGEGAASGSMWGELLVFLAAAFWPVTLLLVFAVAILASVAEIARRLFWRS